MSCRLCESWARTGADRSHLGFSTTLRAACGHQRARGAEPAFGVEGGRFTPFWEPSPLIRFFFFSHVRCGKVHFGFQLIDCGRERRRTDELVFGRWNSFDAVGQSKTCFFLGRRGPSAKRPRSNYCAYHNFPILSITHPPPPSSSSSFSLAHYQGRPRAPHTHSFIDIIGEFFVARVIWRTRRSGMYRCVNRTKPRTGASYYASHRQSFLFSFHHNPFRFNGPSNGRPGHHSIPYHHWLINVSLSLFFS